ncbi:MAG TPA: hypothetical protein VFJ97_06145 [Dermatophilaceae bacterium]|nr:hypothetical protein [Dermatophilaceae bacterium]
MTRVYLPLAAGDLQALLQQEQLPAPRLAFLVTDAQRRADPQADEEELEYDALTEAGEVQLGPRRIVVAADVELHPADGAASPAQLAEPVPLRRVVSCHVSAAGAAPDDELLWYDATELPILLTELLAPG